MVNARTRDRGEKRMTADAGRLAQVEREALSGFRCA